MTRPHPAAGAPDSVPAAAPAAATSTRVAAYLREAILSGAIAPGTRIRQEEIAERLGASRLPVREALRILEAEGLTEHEANRGARVPRLTAREADVVYRMRERLEPLALAQSIPALAPAAVERLADVQRRIEATTDLGEFLDLDREFHLGSYAGCPVQQLTATVTRLWNSTQHYRRAYVALSGPDRMWVINAEHRLILDAVERGDTDGAEQCLGGHIRRTRIALGRHPEIFAETSR
ncbi:GntR family transcriptional regulator [Streptomyces sp. NPDC088387]|uniref:GntR family transcriptional regulator n=1 Tax=Streptomyces sp. NPDC088387 TaxID=3365859 RepID=UPI00380C9EA1